MRLRAILSKFALACQQMRQGAPERQLDRKPMLQPRRPVMRGRREKSIRQRWDAPSEGQNAIKYTVYSAKRSKEESDKQQLVYLLSE